MPHEPCHFSSSPESLGDVCYTAGAGRTQFDWRVAFAGRTAEELKTKAAAFAQGEADPGAGANRATAGREVLTAASSGSRLGWLFTGQGSQYVGMGRELYESEPTFRAAMVKCDKILQADLGCSLIDVIYGAAAKEETLEQTKYTQPAIFAVEYALAELWKSWGIEPAMVAGHSIGEYVAACVAGMLPLEDALKLVAARGRLMQSLPAGGSMAAVFAEEDVVRQAIAGLEVSIAAVNAAGNTTISGKSEAVSEALSRLKKQKVASKALKVSHAFHSTLMEPILKEFEAVAAKVKYARGRIPLISTVTAAKLETVDAAYWTRQLREAVRFRDAVRAMEAEGIRTYLEIGSHTILSTLAQQSVTDEAGSAFLASLKRGEEGWGRMVESLGGLYARGAAITWSGFDARPDRKKVSLPTYPFQRKRYWMDPVRSAEAAPSGHPFIGQKLESPALENAVVFQTVFTDARPAFLSEHVIYDRIISPAAAHVSMALTVCRELWGSATCRLEDVDFLSPLAVERGEARTVQFIVNGIKDPKPSFRIVSRGEADDWTEH